MRLPETQIICFIHIPGILPIIQIRTEIYVIYVKEINGEGINAGTPQPPSSNPGDLLALLPADRSRYHGGLPLISSAIFMVRF